MAPRIKPKPSGIAQYKYRPRPAGKTGQKKQNVLHIPGQWFDVLMLCHQWETEHHGRQGVVAAIAKQKWVKYRTLARHWATWKSAIRNECGNQSLVARVNKENRGGHNRILTPHQERVLCTRLYQYHADCGLVITDKIIIREALLLLNELQADLIPRQRVTSLSSGWVSGFKERLGWRSERIAAHPVKPPPVTADVKRFATSAKRFADSIPARLVINIDETKIKQTNQPRSTLRLPKQPYSVNIGEHPTHGETALMGASMSGHKFPIGLIVKEERKDLITDCKQATGIHGVRYYTTESGWNNGATMAQYILDVIVPYAGGEHALLVLDEYSGHSTIQVFEACVTNNITLMIVPGRATPIAQPMDISVFANVKRALQSSWQAAKEQHPLMDVTPVESVKHLVAAWADITTKTIAHGWNELWKLVDIPPSAAPGSSSSAVHPSIAEAKSVGVHADSTSTRAANYPRAITKEEHKYKKGLKKAGHAHGVDPFAFPGTTYS